MNLFERILSSPKDYPIPPLKIKEKINNFYKTYNLDGEPGPMDLNYLKEAEENHSAVKRRYRKQNYIASPNLRKPRLEPLRFFHVPTNLLWIYERAREKQTVKDALRRKRLARKKEKTIEKVVIQVVEIRDSPPPKNVVEVNGEEFLTPDHFVLIFKNLLWNKSILSTLSIRGMFLHCFLSLLMLWFPLL